MLLRNSGLKSEGRALPSLTAQPPILNLAERGCVEDQPPRVEARASLLWCGRAAAGRGDTAAFRAAAQLRAPLFFLMQLPSSFPNIRTIQKPMKQVAIFKGARCQSLRGKPPLVSWAARRDLAGPHRQQSPDLRVNQSQSSSSNRQRRRSDGSRHWRSWNSCVRNPGALPRAGIWPGLWPSKSGELIHQRRPSQRQRRAPIPAWGNAPGQSREHNEG